MNDKVKTEKLESVVNALPIPIDEEVELAKKVYDDEGAGIKLVDANQTLVTFLAKQYLERGICLEKLVEIGNEGLIKAAQQFDENSGFHFISFVAWWIRKSILDAIENFRVV
jgi:RNA polymerase primary sigma factor